MCLGTPTPAGFASPSEREGGPLPPVDTEARTDVPRLTSVTLTSDQIHVPHTWENTADTQKLRAVSLTCDGLLDPKNKRTTAARVPVGEWTPDVGELYERSRHRRSRHSYLWGEKGI